MVHTPGLAEMILLRGLSHVLPSRPSLTTVARGRRFVTSADTMNAEPLKVPNPQFAELLCHKEQGLRPSAQSSSETRIKASWKTTPANSGSTDSNRHSHCDGRSKGDPKGTRGLVQTRRTLMNWSRD